MYYNQYTGYEFDGEVTVGHKYTPYELRKNEQRQAKGTSLRCLFPIKIKTIGKSDHNFYKKCGTNKEQKQQLVPDKDLGSVVLFGWNEA